MSYDFRFFSQVKGEDPRETAGREGEADLPSMRVQVALNQRIATALVSHDPALNRHESAAFDDRDADLVHIQLFALQDDDGILIELGPDETWFHIAYFLPATQAAEAFGKTRDYAEIIQRESGCLIYDPQLDRLLGPDDDFQASLSSYLKTGRTVGAALAAKASQRPWWKLW